MNEIHSCSYHCDRPKCIKAQRDELRERLAQPEQEPHSWYSKQVDEWMTNKTRKEHERLNSYTHKFGKFDLALYTDPPQRTWAGLKDEQADQIISGLQRCHHQSSKREFLKVWLRDWAAHGIKEDA